MVGDNFEIARLDFYRSERYQNYFRFLDDRGLFFYERTGDAPVHSLAVGLFLRKRQVRFFDSIGYIHPPLQHCPVDEGERENDFTVYGFDQSAVTRNTLKQRWGRCYCDPTRNFDDRMGSCLARWKKFPTDLYDDDDDDDDDDYDDETNNNTT